MKFKKKQYHEQKYRYILQKSLNFQILFNPNF